MLESVLEAGKHVKLRVFLRGREMANPEWGIEVLNKVCQDSLISEILNSHQRKMDDI